MGNSITMDYALHLTVLACKSDGVAGDSRYLTGLTATRLMRCIPT